MRSILINTMLWAMVVVGGQCAMAQGERNNSVDGAEVTYVKGQVVEALTGKPAQGVKVAAGPYSALTDEQGLYKVRVPSLMVQLTLSSEGYQSRIIPLQGDSVKNISVYSDAFRTMKGEDAFTNTQAISVENILGERWGSDVRTISRGALGGQGANMYIRGYNSLNVNAQPLIVVDGTIWDTSTQVESVHDGFYENPLAFIDVNDIESVQVLKDATSIYGSKGANGVILIKTKRGRSVATRIAADISYGFVQSPRSMRMMNAGDYRTYLSEMLKGSDQSGKWSTLFDGFLGMNPSSSTYSTYHQNNDWTDNVTRNGNLQHYGINVQGGDDIAKYSISLSYTGNKGTVESTDFSRLNARINSDVYLTRTLTLASDVYFTNLNYNLQDDGVNSTTAPRYLALIKAPFLVGYSYTDDGTKLTNTLNDVDDLGVSNPLALLENAENTNKQYRFGVSLTPKWKITDDWMLEGQFSYNFNNSKSHYFSPMVGVSPQIVGNQVWENTVKDQTMTQNSLLGTVRIGYTKLINDNHFIDAFAGYRIMNSSFKSVYEDGHNTGNDQVSNMNNSLSYRTVDGLNTSWNSVALYAQARYSYEERYNLWAAVSLDASSRFGKDAPGSFRMCGGSWGTFPSVGASWLVSNERFMRALPFIDRLNLRTSFGITGNDNIDGMYGYSYLSSINYLGSAVGLKLANLANSSLKWETTRKWNLGLDMAFLNDRVGVSLDYYRHYTKDLLTWKQADTETGLDMYLVNGGEMSNQGFEITLSAKVVDTKRFKWSTELGLAKYKNEIQALPDGDYTTEILGGEILTAVGLPAGVFYGYKSDGVYSTEQEAKAANLKIQNSDASYSYFHAGDMRFVENKIDGILDENDKVVIGDPNPDFTGSFANRFTVGRFVLDVLSTFRSGGDIYNYQRSTLEAMSTTYNQTGAVMNRWRVDGQQTDMPKATFGDPMGNSRFSSRWIEDGSFFKLKNVKLSYSLPINNIFIQGVTFWVGASNLLTLTHYLGPDPEVSMQPGVLYQGIDNGLLSHGREYHIGVKLNL